jgi:hypothetical protein
MEFLVLPGDVETMGMFNFQRLRTTMGVENFC